MLRIAAMAWRQAMSPAQYPPTPVPRAFVAAFELSDVERDFALRSAVNSLALEGVHLTYEEASRLLDEVLLEPLPDIG